MDGLIIGLMVSLKPSYVFGIFFAAALGMVAAKMAGDMFIAAVNTIITVIAVKRRKKSPLFSEGN